MEQAQFLSLLINTSSKYVELNSLFTKKGYPIRLADLDEKINKTLDLWNNPKLAAALTKERSEVFNLLDTLAKINQDITYAKEIMEVMPEEYNTVVQSIQSSYGILEQIEVNQLLGDPINDNGAILTINCGAGGNESKEWVTMLLRMYLRFCAANNYQVEILDKKASEEYASRCTDSVCLSIAGEKAYGYFKSETGVHRLIRNSPFNAGGARQTSFAAVQVSADIEDTIEIKIDEKDVEMSFQLSSGAGGQSVNTTESAVRLKHLPTGIQIVARTEKDQHANRKIAFKLLKAKLYDLELKKQNEEKEKLLGTLSSNSFGNQIRTYYINPYSLVKDHRTSFENNNVNEVLDGNIKDFMTEYLKKNASNN